MAMSDDLERKIGNATLRGVAYTSPTNVYLALFTTDPTDAGTGTEVSAASYNRKIVSDFTEFTGTTGTSSNTTEIVFDQAQEDWGTVTHGGIYDSLTAGNLMYHTVAGTPEAVTTNNTYKVAAGDLDITLS